MSLQIFLQGQLHGIEEFLVSAPHESEKPAAGELSETLLIGRSRWVTLLSEVLPRALLEELGLPKVLLGSSGGGQFLLVLPGDLRLAAEEFLTKAANEIRDFSSGNLSLIWNSTENLGDWSLVRRRLSEGAERYRLRPLAGAGPQAFEPFLAGEPADTGGYFTRVLAPGFQEAKSVSWSPEQPAKILFEGGKHFWPLNDSPESIAVARHMAPATEDGVAGAGELATRAEGRKSWGVLRGDVDNFDHRFRQLLTIEEHVQLSLLYKRFFAGELEVLCSLPDFWQKVSILYSGGQNFAVFGSWDALVLLAREVQRLFHRFNEENLKDIPGTEGKTISMGLAMAPESDVPLTEVYLEAGRGVRIAQSAGRDCFHVFGHTVEWRQMAQAGDLHDGLSRLVKDFGGSPHLLGDLIRFYKQSGSETGSPAGERFIRPWRYHRRLSLVAPGARDREYQKLRTKLVVDLIGKGAAKTRLRPGGRVALEWARLLSEG